MYVYTMFDFIFNNNIDVALLLVSLFATLLTSYLTLKELSLLDSTSYKVVKFQSKVDIIIGIISFTLLFVFGISLITNVIINGMNYPKILIGSFIVIIYIYVIYTNCIYKKDEVFKIIRIDKLGDKLFLLSLENNDEGLIDYYIDNKDNVKKGKLYKCSYNKFNKRVIKIINEVVDVK